MKYCEKCGHQMVDDAVICTACGCPTHDFYAVVSSSSEESSGITTATKVFMIIGAVVNGLTIIGLAWALPMTLSYFNKLKNNEPISTGFKVCALLFVSAIAGCLMLCDKNH